MYYVYGFDKVAYSDTSKVINDNISGTDLIKYSIWHCYNVKKTIFFVI